MRRLLAVAIGGLVLSGCADPYQYSYYNPPPLAAPPVSRYTPPPYPTSPYQASPYNSPATPPYDAPIEPAPQGNDDNRAPPRDALPTDTGEYETPPVLLQPLPGTSDLQPTTGTPTAGTPADAASPAVVTSPRQPSDNSGNVPMMGFRPMKGQRSPGA